MTSGVQHSFHDTLAVCRKVKHGITSNTHIARQLGLTPQTVASCKNEACRLLYEHLTKANCQRLLDDLADRGI